MLETSFGLSFFLKPSAKEKNIRYIYLRITVDGIRKEASTKRTWDINRWDAKAERATGNKEDARTLNHFLDTIKMKINKYKTDLLYSEKSTSAQRVIDFVLGKATCEYTTYSAHYAFLLNLLIALFFLFLRIILRQLFSSPLEHLLYQLWKRYY